MQVCLNSDKSNPKTQTCHQPKTLKKPDDYAHPPSSQNKTSHFDGDMDSSKVSTQTNNSTSPEPINHIPNYSNNNNNFLSSSSNIPESHRPNSVITVTSSDPCSDSCNDALSSSSNEEYAVRPSIDSYSNTQSNAQVIIIRVFIALSCL